MDCFKPKWHLVIFVSEIVIYFNHTCRNKLCLPSINLYRFQMLPLNTIKKEICNRFRLAISTFSWDLKSLKRIIAFFVNSFSLIISQSYSNFVTFSLFGIKVETLPKGSFWKNHTSKGGFHNDSFNIGFWEGY